MKAIVWMLVAVFAIVSQGNAQKKKELNTTVNMNYCLPKVVYNVEVTMKCTKYIPGPYSNHAEKELNLKPEITQAGERWSIAKIELKPTFVPDPKTMYTISASIDYNPILLSLSAEGFLAGVATGSGGVFNEAGMKAYVAEAQPEEDEINIVQLNTYNHLKEVLDTNYTYQEVDGEMKKIWDPLIRYVRKSEADNVKEAVSEIFRIRSERVKMLAAENNIPDGKSLEIILKEFEQMEANYLSLFMGKEETTTVKRVISCELEKMDEPVVAFRFSAKEGIADSKNVSAIPYSLKLTDVVVSASTPVNGEVASAGVFYRVPAVGVLKVLKGKDEVMNIRAIVPQLGEVKKFPVDVISNEGLMLEFYPQYGALKSIRRK